MEKRLMIPAGDIELEAAVGSGETARAGVVLHPHPLYGGSMASNVVLAATEALRRAGWTSLRFNFRGVGLSTGGYGQGLAEGDDAAAAVSFLKQGGAGRTVVIGYSFGAWVAAFAWKKLKELGVSPLILIAPPAAFMSFDGLPEETEVGLMICGEQDDIAPPGQAEALGGRLASPIAPLVVKGADHFFGGHESLLTEILTGHLQTL